MCQDSKVEGRYFKSRRRHTNKRFTIRKCTSRKKPTASRIKETTKMQQKS